MLTDEAYMQVALQLAASVVGQVSPNPAVGAVVVRNQHIVGLGAHLRAGEAHAEVHALGMAGAKAQDATLYVTLEPCSHHGRTPPCADLVIRSGIKRVFIASLDPNPLVAGQGVQKLKEAGLKVEVGLLDNEAKQINEVFNHFIVHKRPFVTLKTASTLDGKIATVTGESKWITGEAARADVHLLRHHHEAILVGVNTVLKDNPRLTTRIAGEAGRHPLRVILDSRLRTPLDAEVVRTDISPTWIFTTTLADQAKRELLTERGVRIFQLPAEQIAIDEVLRILGEQQISSLLIEGGGQVNASFLEGNFVNKVIMYLAPKLIGGNRAPTSFSGQGFASLEQVPALQRVQYIPIGEDLKVVGYLR